MNISELNISVPAALGIMAAPAGYCFQSGKERLLIDPLPGALDEYQSGEGVSVFYTRIPKDWAAIPDGARVYLGANDLPLIAAKDGFRSRLYRKEGYPATDVLPPQSDAPDAGLLGRATPVRNGTELTVSGHSFRCVHTPGPTPGHTCLYLPEEEILFSGALLSVPPDVEVCKGFNHALEKLLSSLERIREFPVKRLFPLAEGETELRERADYLIRHCYFRVLELYRLVQDHPGLTACELAKKFLRLEAAWDAVSPQERWHAMDETLAHLNYLRQRDYVHVQKGASGQVNLPGTRRLTDVF